MKPPLWPWVLGSMVPFGVPQQDGTGGPRWLPGLSSGGTAAAECQRGVSLPSPGPIPSGVTRHPPHPLPSALLTHITLVLPAVLPLMVRVAHAAVAIDMDVTWRVRGTESGVGLLGTGEAGIQSPTITTREAWLWGQRGDLLDGKPPPKNMLKRSSGEMSASKPRWKSPCPWPCRAAWLLSSPNWSYCFLFSGLLSTAYAVPMARKEVERSGPRMLGVRLEAPVAAKHSLPSGTQVLL